MNGKFRKSIALLTGICLSLGMLPGRVSASAVIPEKESIRSINLGTDILTAPSKTSASWSGSRVYLGGLSDKSGSVPIVWRVLDPGSKGNETILLQADEMIKAVDFAGTDSGDTGEVQWSGSAVQDYLNRSGKSGFLYGFDSQELDAVKKSNTAEQKDLAAGEWTFTNPASSGDKVFLLSAAEVMKAEYGYGRDSARKMSSLTVSDGNGGTQTVSDWWLRSSVKDGEDQIAVVDKQGSLVAKDAYEQKADGGFEAAKAGLVPALYLDASRVLFLTSSDQKKADKILPVTSGQDSVWKMTLLSGTDTVNNSLKAALTENDGSSLYEQGATVKIKHNYAKSRLAAATQVSALILNEAGEPVYYGKLNADTKATVSSFAIPEDMKAGMYQLYIFAEEIHGTKETDYACALGNAISIEVDTKRTPQVAQKPVAGEITYGQSLADSVITGGKVQNNGAEVAGTFRWKDSSIVPSVSDSEQTQYEAEFVPAKEDTYYKVSLTLTLKVKKAAVPTTPAKEISVPFETAYVKQVTLPEGWKWQAEYAEQELTPGGANQVKAAYKDTANYDNSIVDVVIKRAACVHQGGTATCISPAICDICGQPYGEIDPNHHGETVLQGVKYSTCTELGYTGDLVCKDCGKVLEKGKDYPMTAHQFREEITRQPTEWAEGERTFTCQVCGYQYKEAIGKHNHYYYRVTTLKWADCTNKGEIEHYCECGDSYIEEVPALGHDYKAVITKKATTEAEGIKTYTCSRCGHSYTEKIAKLSGGSTESGDKVSDNTGDRKPYVKGNKGISGWNDINRHILKAADGAIIQINMNGSFIVPTKTLETIQGKKRTLILDMGDDIQWSISGEELAGEKLADKNLKVTRNSGAIPENLISQAASGNKTVKLSLAEEKSFGTGMRLEIKLSEGTAGQYANLFAYQKDSGTLNYVDSSQLSAEKLAGFPIENTGEYLIVISDSVMDGSSPAEPTEPSKEPEPTQSSSEPSSGEVIPADNDKVKELSSISPLVIVMVGLIIIGCGLLILVLVRNRKKSGYGYEYVDDEQDGTDDTSYGDDDNR